MELPARSGLELVVFEASRLQGLGSIDLADFGYFDRPFGQNSLEISLD